MRHGRYIVIDVTKNCSKSNAFTFKNCIKIITPMMHKRPTRSILVFNGGSNHFFSIMQAQTLFSKQALTSSSILLNSSKQAQAPDCARPLKNLPIAL